MKTYLIHLSNLNMPRRICDIFKYNQTKNYVYSYHTTRHGVFNYGMSGDNEWGRGSWGNRTYRKAGGIPGWRYMLHDTSALKMSQLMSLYLPDVRKDDVIITVYDYTVDLINESYQEIDRFLLNEENRLIRNYERQFGCLPLLNIQNTKAHPKPEFDRLFEAIQ